MSVGVAYEIVDGVVCEDFNIVEHVLEDMLQCHVAQCVSIYDCKTWIHIRLSFLSLAKFLEDLKIFIKTVIVILFHDLLVKLFCCLLVAIHQGYV